MLEIFGRSLLAIGLGDVALQNLNGCRRLSEEFGKGAETCPIELIASVKELQKSTARLQEAVEKELWPLALERADIIFARHSSVLPRFERSYWGLAASSARCLAMHALNRTEMDQIMQPCSAVADAEETMRQRLRLLDVIRCNMALAEVLERSGSLAVALKRADSATQLLNEDSTGALESISAEAHVLRERIARALRKEQERGAGEETNQTGNDTG